MPKKTRENTSKSKSPILMNVPEAVNGRKKKKNPTDLTWKRLVIVMKAISGKL